MKTQTTTYTTKLSAAENAVRSWIIKRFTTAQIGYAGAAKGGLSLAKSNADQWIFNIMNRIAKLREGVNRESHQY
ncbi:hypothetical protein [Yersinia massiliensis]|uniref:hypothetical protein n=1 Tax=Yersinia massiliensis TaxID=419257 RepID=UPI00117D03B3|nr:hypothetical protein [Yersinia massiliensis]